MAASTKSIAETVVTQQESMLKLHGIVRMMSEDTITAETRSSIQEFIANQLVVHPEHTAKLNEILELLKDGKP